MRLRYEVRVPHPDDETPYEPKATVFDTWAEAKAFAETIKPPLVAFVDLYEHHVDVIDDSEFGLVELDDWQVTDFYGEYYDGGWNIDDAHHGEEA